MAGGELTLPRTGLAGAATPQSWADALAGFKTPLGSFLGASLSSGFHSATPVMGYEQDVIRGLERPPSEDDLGIGLAERITGRKLRPEPTYLTKEEWEQGPHFRKGVPFHETLTEESAKYRASLFDANAYNEALRAHTPSGIVNNTLGFTAQMIGGLPDPVNFVGLGFIERAAMAARALRSPLARAATRAGAAAAEVGVTSAAVEPLIVAHRKDVYGVDSSWAEIVTDIALGAATGAAISGAVDAYGALRSGRAAPAALSPDAPMPRTEPPTPAEAATTPPPAPGMVRMYRGDAPDWSTEHSAWFTSDLRQAQGYAGREGVVAFVDLPAGHPLIAPEWPDQTIASGHHVSRELPQEIAKTRALFQGAQAAPPPMARVQRATAELNAAAHEAVLGAPVEARRAALEPLPEPKPLAAADYRAAMKPVEPAEAASAPPGAAKPAEAAPTAAPNLSPEAAAVKGDLDDASTLIARKDVGADTIEAQEFDAALTNARNFDEGVDAGIERALTCYRNGEL